MSDQYLFVCTNIGSEKFLKEEVRIFYPELRLSYSKKGFITFKNTGVHYNLKSISELELTFATRAGICFGKSNPEMIVKDLESIDLKLDECVLHSFSIGCEFELDHEKIFGREVNNYSASDKNVIDVITLGEKEIWFGAHYVIKGTTRFPNAQTSIRNLEQAPSKSYFKLSQICELYGIKTDRSDNWLDFGSSPGGSSYYLLSKGCKVWGVDPAKMDESILSHHRYSHISKPLQDLSQEELPEDIHWVHADVNISPKQSIKEILRLIKKYNFSIKGILFTIQVSKLEHIENIEKFEEEFFEWGFDETMSRQVPAHKNEYILIAKKLRNF